MSVETDLVSAPASGPTVAHTTALARRVPREPHAAGWRLERVLSDNSNEFRALAFGACLQELGARHSRIRAGRPQTNGHVDRLHRTILEACWRPAFALFHVPGYTGLKRRLDAYITYSNHHRAHTGRTTAGRAPADLVYGARRMEPRRAAPVGTTRISSDQVSVKCRDPDGYVVEAASEPER